MQKTQLRIDTCTDFGVSTRPVEHAFPQQNLLCVIDCSRETQPNDVSNRVYVGEFMHQKRTPRRGEHLEISHLNYD